MSNTAEISSKLKLANVFKVSKKYILAEAIYQDVIDKYPSDFRAYFNLGQLHLSLGREPSTIISLFQRVLELDPSVLETYGILSGLYIKMKEPDQAVHYCRAGLALNRTDSSCWFNLNVALRQCGRISDAIQETWSALPIDRTKYAKNSSEPSSSSSSSNASAYSGHHLTVVCIKWGSKYSAEYVNNLYSAIIRHYGSDVRFICFTDDSTGILEDVECNPFDACLSSFQAWWLKIQVFSPAWCSSSSSEATSLRLLKGWVLYIDLDTVICNSLSFLDSIINKQSETNTIDMNIVYVLDAEQFQNEGKCDII